VLQPWRKNGGASTLSAPSVDLLELFFYAKYCGGSPHSEILYLKKIKGGTKVYKPALTESI
jgi:hypothetical protein